MIKIPSVNYFLKRRRYLKRGSIHLAHWPNGGFCHVVKNFGGMTNIFDTGACGFMTRATDRFRRSTKEAS